MKILKYFWFCFALITANAQEWEWQNPLPQGNYLMDICFVDTLYGWAVGYNGTVMRTTNGGNNWERVETNFNKLISKASFVDREKGWLMSYYDDTIYNTVDGGMNWDSIACLSSIPPGGGFYDFVFINDTLGFACGSDAKIVRTTDGGYTWEIRPTPLPASTYFNSIYFINETIGWAAGTGSVIIKTQDGGDSWISKTVPVLDFSGFKIHFVNNLRGYIAGYDNGHGVLLSTYDGGNIWHYKAFNNTLYDVYFSSPDTGWVSDSNGEIYYTTNSGNNWTLMSESCHNFYFANKQLAWGISNLNLIKKTNDGWNSSFLQTPSITSAILWSVSVLDSQHVVACGQYKNIVGTSDGGSNWNEYYRSNSNIYLNDILYKSSMEIWAVGQSGTVIYTKDGGISWSEISLGNSWFSSIDFIDESIGFIVGVNSSGGVIYKTEDGGESWELHLNDPNISYFDKVRFSSSYLGWILGEDNILRSTDMGKTWQSVHTSTIDFADISVYENHAWAGYINRVLITQDSGNTWQSVKVYDIEFPIIRSITSVAFTDLQNGWVCADGGKFYRTMDGGFTWNQEKQISGIGLYSIRFANPGNGWAVGAGGAIIHYGDQVNSIRNIRNVGLSENYHLYQNYPNPFNPLTNLRFQIADFEFIELSIFDITGRRVRTLVKSKMAPGNYTYQWNGRDDAGREVASGVYIYRLKAQDQIFSRKMLLLR